MVSGSENGPLSDSGVRFANGGGLLLSCPHLGIANSAFTLEVLFKPFCYFYFLIYSINFIHDAADGVEIVINDGSNVLHVGSYSMAFRQ